jgi:hypothetical protein
VINGEVFPVGVGEQNYDERFDFSILNVAKVPWSIDQVSRALSESCRNQEKANVE